MTDCHVEKFFHPAIVRKGRAWRAGGQSCAEIFAVSYSGVVYILGLSGKEEKGDRFCAEIFAKLNHILCGAILNTAITKPYAYEAQHNVSIKCTNI